MEGCCGRQRKKGAYKLHAPEILIKVSANIEPLPWVRTGLKEVCSP